MQDLLEEREGIRRLSHALVRSGPCPYRRDFALGLKGFSEAHNEAPKGILSLGRCGQGRLGLAWQLWSTWRGGSNGIDDRLKPANNVTGAS